MLVDSKRVENSLDIAITPIAFVEQGLMDHPLLGVAARLVVGGVFISAGILKFNASGTEPLSMLEAIGMRSNVLLRTSLRVLPAVELLLGLWLFSGWKVWASLTVAALFALLFIIVLVMALRAGYAGGCGCFGDGAPLGLAEVVFNGMLLALVALAAIEHHRTETEFLSLLDFIFLDWAVLAILALWILASRSIVRQMEILARLLE
jgi:hypothetical protein